MALDLNSVVSYAKKALEGTTQLLSVGASIASVVGLVTKARDSLGTMQAEQRGPTQAEWDELDAEINKLRQQLHSP